MVAPRFMARAGVLSSLGLETRDMEVNGFVIGSYIPADANGATSVAGVWVAGNVSDLQAQVITSAAAGLKAGAMINADLIAEETKEAVAALRARGHVKENQEGRRCKMTIARSNASGRSTIKSASACGAGGRMLLLGVAM